MCQGQLEQRSRGPLRGYKVFKEQQAHNTPRNSGNTRCARDNGSNWSTRSNWNSRDTRGNRSNGSRGPQGVQGAQGEIYPTYPMYPKVCKEYKEFKERRAHKECTSTGNSRNPTDGATGEIREQLGRQGKALHPTGVIPSNRGNRPI